MPDTYIVYRKLFEEHLGYTPKWLNSFNNLNNDEFNIIRPIIEKNDFRYLDDIKDPKLISILKHYTISRTSVKKYDSDYMKIKRVFDQLILNDNFLNLTITSDFEDNFEMEDLRTASG